MLRGLFVLHDPMIYDGMRCYYVPPHPISEKVALTETLAKYLEKLQNCKLDDDDDLGKL